MRVDCVDDGQGHLPDGTQVRVFLVGLVPYAIAKVRQHARYSFQQLGIARLSARFESEEFHSGEYNTELMERSRLLPTRFWGEYRGAYPAPLKRLAKMSDPDIIKAGSQGPR